MNTKKKIIMGIAYFGIFAFANVGLYNAQAKEDSGQVVFSPKANESECTDPSHCVYYGTDGILVFVIPSTGV